MNTHIFWTLGLCSTLAGCSEPLVLQPPDDTTELAVGESRIVELRSLRLDVHDFGRTLTLHDLRQLPRKTLEETWLFDLNARPLVENALARFIFLPAEKAANLEPAARNLFYLLNMTPENANLEGTALADLAAVGAAVGISPSRILADLFQVSPNARLAPIEVVTDVVLERVIATHPRAHDRPGPITDQNPRGMYSVPAGFIAISLADLASDFSSLAKRFGPASNHPGFLSSVSGISLSEQSFSMTIRSSLNALPFQGIEAFRAAKASVNGVGMQIDTAFDFQNPQWMTITGLGDKLTLREVVMTLEESEKDPPPPWALQSILMDVGNRLAGKITPHCTAYGPAGRVSPPFQAVNVCIDARGWVEFHVDPSIIFDSPPRTRASLSELLLDVANARLRDGGLSETAMKIILPVRDVPVGIDSSDIIAKIRTNIENEPILLRRVAQAISDATYGDADFFYSTPPKSIEDWLYFVAPDDIRLDAQGLPVRAYAYRQPGFFADSSLQTKISTRENIDGDTTHEKIHLRPHEKVYFQDADERVFEITTVDKPSGHRIRLEIKRIS